MLTLWGIYYKKILKLLIFTQHQDKLNENFKLNECNSWAQDVFLSITVTIVLLVVSFTPTLDEMGTRIDGLEKNVAELMTQAGMEEQAVSKWRQAICKESS